MTKISSAETIEEPIWQGKAHLTTREAAAFLAVGRTTFLMWAKLYRLKCMGRDKAVRWPVGEVLRLRDRLTRDYEGFVRAKGKG